MRRSNWTPSIVPNDNTASMSAVARTRSDLAGKVDHGFDKKSSAELRKRLTPLIRKTQPYTKRIAHKGIWVEPELNAEIEYRAKSAGKGAASVLSGAAEDL